MVRALIQRVHSASVTVEGAVTGQIGRGLLILLGVGPTDTETEVERLWHKIFNLRIFDDADGKMNLSLATIGGEALVVSQFTLYADCRRGNRPSFVGAAAPAQADDLYKRFCRRAEADAVRVGRGIFGAEMQVALVNDGPVTIWLDTDELNRPRRQ